MRADVIAGGAFLAIGLLLISTGLTFPEGVGGLPGAGFFPQVIGGVMAVLACALLVQGYRTAATGTIVLSNLRQVGGTVALLLAYLLLWGTGFFAVRTIVFLAVMLRFLGQGWPSALGFAAALTAFVYAAFDLGLNVTLE